MARHEDDQTDDRSSSADTGSSLAVAEANIRRRLRAVGPIPAGERYGAEWRALGQWYQEAGLIRLPDGLLWWKFTKPWASGYAVDLSGCEPMLLPARPLQYLARLKLQNRYFGDAMRFVGITHDAKSRRIVISQPDIQGCLAS